MPLTMQITKWYVRDDTKCFWCNKAIDDDEKAVMHWNVEENEYGKFNVRTIEYHEHCFYNKRDTMDKFDVEIIEFDIHDVLQAAKDLRK